MRRKISVTGGDTSLRVKSETRDALKSVAPDMSFDEAIKGLIAREIEHPSPQAPGRTKESLSDDTQKALREKFDLDENADIESIVKDYLIGEKQKRVDAIKSTGVGEALTDLHGTDDETLLVIEKRYLAIDNCIENEDGKITLVSLAKSIKVMAGLFTNDAIKLSKEK